jgi:hypothetical protein
MAERLAERPVETAPSSPASPELPRAALLAGALAMGVAGNVLLFDSSGPGLNLFLMYGVLALAVGAVLRGARLRPSAEAVTWMAGGVLLASTFAFRASPTLQFLALLTASAAFAFPALRAGAAWLRGSGVSAPVESIAGALLHSAFGPVRFLVGGLRREAPSNRPAPPSSAGQLLRGLLLALPLLFVFGALFMGADPVFEGIVVDLFRDIAIDRVVGRLVLFGALAWLASGYLAGFVGGTEVRGRLGPILPRPTLGMLETGVVLALVNLLFGLFVLVQLRYLFGGSTLVEVTPGLTYAEYARDGFVQLVVAVGLVLPLLLAADWLVRREGSRDARVFRWLGGIQLVLVGVIIVSAFQRVRIYLEAYGLTESRFYGVAALLWLALVSTWFAATVLRGRREHFAAPALVSAFVVVGVLLVANPDDRIAQANLARAGTSDEPETFDAAYLASLSADAVPTLLEALPGLAEVDRCTVAAALVRGWGHTSRADWRSWNLSESRAHRLVAGAPPQLLATASCPADVSPGGPATPTSPPPRG